MPSTQTLSAASAACPTTSDNDTLPSHPSTSNTVPSCPNSGISGFQKAFTEFEKDHPGYRGKNINDWWESNGHEPYLSNRAFLRAEGTIAGISFDHRKGGYNVFFPIHKAKQSQEDHADLLSEVWNTLSTDDVTQDQQMEKLHLAAAVAMAANSSTAQPSGDKNCGFIPMEKSYLKKMTARGQVMFYPGSVDDVSLQYPVDDDGDRVRSGAQWEREHGIVR
jgi:hypothetical protein